MSQTDSSRLHRRLTLNSISNFARFAFMMLVTLFLTPFIVRTLGESLYGFWVLLMSFLGYAGILEMGVQPAVVKLVGQYKGTDDEAKLRRLISAAFVFFSAAGTIAALLCLTIIPLLVFRHVDGIEAVSGQRMLLFSLIAADAVIMYMSYLFSGILYGCQRYHLKNLIDVGSNIINIVLIVSFLEKGGIIAILFAKLTRDLVNTIATMIAARRAIPGMEISLKQLNWSTLRELMGFGGRIFISATTTRIATHAQPMIISAALTAAATAFYAIPVRLVDYSRQISWTLTASFMPMFSELDGRNERGLLRSVYLNYSRYVFMILLPILLLLFVYGVSFIGLWIGPEFAERGRIVLYLLIATVLIESFQPLLWRFFVGVGHLNILVTVSAVGSLVVVVLGIILVRPLGIAGVALSVLVGAFIAQSVYAFQSARYLHISPMQMFRTVHMRPLLVAALTLVAARFLSSYLGFESYLAMAAGAALSSVIYAMLSFGVALTTEERVSVTKTLRTVTRRHDRAMAEDTREI